MAVCDIKMPDMNGIDFVKAVKTLASYKVMPTMMPSTESQAAKMDEDKALGVRAWMSKPFSPIQLIKAVDKLCSFVNQTVYLPRLALTLVQIPRFNHDKR